MCIFMKGHTIRCVSKINSNISTGQNKLKNYLCVNIYMFRYVYISIFMYIFKIICVWRHWCSRYYLCVSLIKIRDVQQKNGAHCNSKFCLSWFSLRESQEPVRGKSWTLSPKALEEVWFFWKIPSEMFSLSLIKQGRAAHPSCLVLLVPFQAWQDPSACGLN